MTEMTDEAARAARYARRAEGKPNSEKGPAGSIGVRNGMTVQGPEAATSLPDATRPLVRAKA